MPCSWRRCGRASSSEISSTILAIAAPRRLLAVGAPPHALARYGFARLVEAHRHGAVGINDACRAPLAYPPCTLPRTRCRRNNDTRHALSHRY